MNWDDLRFVLAVGRAGTLSRAAVRLSVTHTTVSRRIAAFEEQLGTRLFDHSRDGWAPTAAGEELIEAATRMEQITHDLDRAVLGSDERMSGKLRVTMIDLVAAQHADLFADFVLRYPKVELQITVDNSFRDLSRREADAAIRSTNRPPPHLIGRKVGHAEYALYGSRALVERHGPEVSHAELPWLAWDERYRAPLTEKWMHKHAPRADVRARIDSSAVMLSLLCQGVGISFFPCIYADPRPELVRLRPVEPGFGMDYWLLTHPDLRRTARVRAFMDHMAQGLSALRDRMAGQP